jgi:hypothetical protein
MIKYLSISAITVYRKHGSINLIPLELHHIDGDN